MDQNTELRSTETISYWTESVEFPEIGELTVQKRDLTVALSPDGVCWISLGEREKEEEELKAYLGRWFPQSPVVCDEAGTAEVRAQLKEYLAGRRRSFDLKLNPQGTPFQRRVWQALCAIPYGQTRSYEDIAIAVGSPKGQRAVGMANNRNPVIVVIPCHRVIGKDGSLTGYGGGLDLKQYLLQLESGELADYGT